MAEPAQPQLPLREPPGNVLKDVKKFLDDLKRQFPEIYEDKPKKAVHVPDADLPASDTQTNLFVEGDVNKARLVIAGRVEHYSRIIGVRCKRICIKDQRTLWGSCSGKGNLNFNWRLVLAPPGVIDYVVIHELCHLLEMNHGKKFWTLVNTHCPDHKRQRLWLKQNTEILRSACPVGAQDVPKPPRPEPAEPA
ncbi:MAG TPA: metal-dependent hydrolase [Elusimicrobia bacterium]|nr:metal-dependent hydrolase [Elusimicrobiota bacterium]